MRVLDVPRSATLPELHRLPQAAMGWVDVHLHEFDTGPARYGPNDRYGDAVGDGPDEGSVWRDETECKLADLGPRWIYRYDFGDGWTHDVEALGRRRPAGLCVRRRGLPARGLRWFDRLRTAPDRAGRPQPP